MILDSANMEDRKAFAITVKRHKLKTLLFELFDLQIKDIKKYLAECSTEKMEWIQKRVGQQH